MISELLDPEHKSDVWKSTQRHGVAGSVLWKLTALQLIKKLSTLYVT